MGKINRSWRMTGSYSKIKTGIDSIDCCYSKNTAFAGVNQQSPLELGMQLFV